MRPALVPQGDQTLTGPTDRRKRPAGGPRRAWEKGGRAGAWRWPVRRGRGCLALAPLDSPSLWVRIPGGATCHTTAFPALRLRASGVGWGPSSFPSCLAQQGALSAAREAFGLRFVVARGPFFLN